MSFLIKVYKVANKNGLGLQDKPNFKCVKRENILYQFEPTFYTKQWLQNSFLRYDCYVNKIVLQSNILPKMYMN